MKIEIVNSQNKSCSQGETDRIRMQTAGLFQGYEEAAGLLTKQTLRDGWFYPDDLSYIDVDGHIIFHGNNIYPRQIEMALEEHPAVKEAAVIGIPFNESEQAPMAVVTLKSGTTSQQILQDINSLFKERLGWQTPVSIKNDR